MPKVKTVPADLSSEAGVIGSLMLDNEWIAQISDILSPSDFHDPDLSRFYQCILELWKTQPVDTKGVIDAILVRDMLNRKYKVDERLVRKLGECMSTLPSAVNCKYYADRVLRHSQDRSLIRLVEKAWKMVWDGGIEPKEKVNTFVEDLGNLDFHTAGKNYSAVSDLAETILDDIKSQKSGVLTGMTGLDAIIDGFSAGELVVMAGRPGMGKSALMLEIALRMAQAKHKVLIYSLEMTRQSLMERMVCNIARVPLKPIRKSWESDKQLEQLEKTVADMKGLDLWIKTSSACSPAELLSSVKLFATRYGLDCVFVDYLQLMRSNKRSSQRNEEISDICRDLKGIAMDMDVPVVVLSQLSRTCESRDNRRPRLTDLRDSGSIEQDAHKVMFLYREDYYRQQAGKPEDCDGKAEIMVAKNRQGPTGMCDYMWDADYFCFEEPKPSVMAD